MLSPRIKTATIKIGGGPLGTDILKKRVRFATDSLSGKQPTSSVGGVVGEQGRGEPGIVGVVCDTVVGVQKALGVRGVDERGRTSTQQAV